MQTEGKSMKIKAGKYTLAFTLIASGILMLINTTLGNKIFDNLLIYSPIVLVLFGLEIIILSWIYRKREDCRVEASFGSIILIILVIAFFMTWTNRVEIHDPFFDNFFSFKF
jgi:hypothetical protein